MKKAIEKLGGNIINEFSQLGGLEINCKLESIPHIKSFKNVKAIAPNHDIEAPKEKYIKFEKAKENYLKRNKSFIQEQDADLYEKYQWDIKRITNNGESFKLGVGNHDVVVAIIDSGVKVDHPDLIKNFMGGENLVPKNFKGDKTETGDPKDISDRLGHGTYAAGNIAANGRTKGVAPNIGFKSYRVFDSNGRTNTSIISSAIIKAANDGVKVINLSMAGYKLKGKCYWKDSKTGVKYEVGDDMAEYQLYERAINYAINHGVTIVTAAGNDGIDCFDNDRLIKYMNNKNKEEGFEYVGKVYEVPGGINGVINVSATGRSDKLAKYSNYGKEFINISAPGGDSSEKGSMLDMCLSTANTDYWFVEGTSIAAPKISAIAGLILCKNKNLKPNEVASKIYKTAEKVNCKNANEYFGAGFANAYNALSIREQISCSDSNNNSNKFLINSIFHNNINLNIPIAS